MRNVTVLSTALLCFLVLPALAQSTAKPALSAWPAFGTFKKGATVQFWTPTGWRKGVVIEVGPQPSPDAKINLNQEKKYFIAQADQPTWQDYYDWGLVAHVDRKPYWSSFFVGDWAVGEVMAVNTRSDGTSAWNEYSYAGAGERLRIRADGTYEWRQLGGKLAKGRWTPAKDGPGVVVKDARGHIWTLRNQTHNVEEKIRRLEGARLFPNDPRDMGQVANRPLRR